LRRIAAASLTLAVALSAIALTPLANPEPAAAASCVRFVASNFDASGNDNYNENGEWVRIKNFCSTGKTLSGWRIHDYKRIHIYTIPTGVRIGPGKVITLYTGKGTNTGSKLFWRQSAAVWNNAPPEVAYLKNASGTLVSKWTEY
jgi:competence protein ComEC